MGNYLWKTAMRRLDDEARAVDKLAGQAGATLSPDRRRITLVVMSDASSFAAQATITVDELRELMHAVIGSPSRPDHGPWVEPGSLSLLHLIKRWMRAMFNCGDLFPSKGADWLEACRVRDGYWAEIERRVEALRHPAQRDATTQARLIEMLDGKTAEAANDADRPRTMLELIETYADDRWFEGEASASSAIFVKTTPPTAYDEIKRRLELVRERTGDDDGTTRMILDILDGRS